MTRSSIGRGAVLNLVAKVVMVALGLAILVVVARLGPATQGAFSLFVAVESGLLTLFSGLGLALSRRVSHGETGVARLLAGALCAALALGAACSLALLLIAGLAEREPYRHLWLLACAAPFLLLVPTAIGLWLGQGRMLPLNVAQIGAPLAVLAVLGALSGSGGLPVVSVLAAWVLGKSLVGLLTAWRALRETGWVRPDLAAVHTDARFVVGVGIANIVSLLNYRATLFLLEQHGGLAATGVYSVAVQVAELLWLLSSAVTVSAYHRIGTPDRAQAAAVTLRAVRINLLATLAAAPVLYFGAAWAVPRVLGPAYLAALAPLAWLLPGIAAYAMASSLSAFFTNHMGRPRWAAGIAGLSLAMTLVFSWWAIPRYGAVGAAGSTSLAYLIAITVALRVFLREVGLGLGSLWRQPTAEKPRQ